MTGFDGAGALSYAHQGYPRSLPESDMSLSRISILLAVGLSAAGCKTTSWQAIDGASGEAAAVAEARKACRIDAKIAGLERAEEERDEELRQASSNASKMVAREDFEQIRRQVWREIDICMARRGYRRND